MKGWMSAWNQFIAAHEALDFVIAIGIAIGVWAALALARFIVGRVLARLVPKGEARWDDVLAETVRATSLWLLFPVVLYAGCLALELPSRLGRIVEIAALLSLILQAGLWANRFIGRWASHKIAASREHEPQGATAMGLISFGARVAAWTFLLLLALDQFGFDITALVAGLGVGGVAVALAVQNILGDLFASLSIVLDKPFVVGDFIVVDNLRGNVERVGIKTTRVRSLDGELLVFSNGDLLKSRIQNYQRMQERRVLFAVGVTYQTPPEKLKQIRQWLREAVEAQERVRFDRAHFKDYGDSSLNFEIVYYVLDRDYNLYMDIQQAINLAIFERFAREGVEFAYPTRTLYVTSVGGEPEKTER